MASALREVLALMDVKVRGADQLRKTNEEIDRFVSRAQSRVAGAIGGPGGTQLMFGGAAGAGGGLMGAAVPGVAEVTAASTAFLAIRQGLQDVWHFAHRASEAVAQFLEGVIRLGVDVNRTSVELGISTEDVQRWSYVADRADINAGALNVSMFRMQREAFRSSARFAQLGVQVRDQNGQIKNASQLFEETGLALGRIHDPAERAARAQQIFGRSARLILPIFSEGERGIRELTARFHELGGGLSQEVVDSARRADDAFDDFRLGMTGLRSLIAARILPILSKVVSFVAKIIGKFIELAKHSSLVQTALGILGGVIASFAIAAVSVLWPILAPIIALGAAFTGLFLVLEDVVTAFRGGQSVLGDWLKRVLHAIGFTGSLQEIGEDLWKTVKQIGLKFLEFGRIAAADVLPRVVRWAETLARIMGPIADAIGFIFHAAQTMPTIGSLFGSAGPGGVVESITGAATAGTNVGRHITNNVTLSPNIKIEGVSDPHAAAREAQRVFTDGLRQAMDAIPQTARP